MCALMLISREKRRFKEIDETKTALGQFQTHATSWLLPQIVGFIKRRAPDILYDPFAGHGDLLRAAQHCISAEIHGLDIDPAAGWPLNDSLRHIPRLTRSVIVTNPPYLAKHSAKRRRIHDAVAERYATRNDLYQLALDQCQAACPYTVAIVPETLLNGDYPKMHFTSITILEDNPFRDTDCPTCVVCIDRKRRPHANGPMIYIGAKEVGFLATLERARLHPNNRVRMAFNVKSGRIALRAVDLPSPGKPIAFMRRNELDYPPQRIKASSRLVTFLEIPDMDETQVDAVIAAANEQLARFRRATSDVLLSPFKGNTKQGKRRRRLDYYTARAIIEQAFELTKYHETI